MKFFIKFLLLFIVLVGVACEREDPNVVEVVKKCGPSVVEIDVITKENTNKQGSGVIVSHDGKIVTNYHVIENAQVVIIKTRDNGFFYSDGVLVTEPEKDLAIIKISAKNLQYAILGDSDELQQGDDIVAIGCPIGESNTVTSGIISKKDVHISSNPQISNMMLISAPIDHGSSGGGVFDLSSKLVGITTLGFSTQTKLTGGMAIPINEVKKFLSVNSIKIPYDKDQDISSFLDITTRRRNPFIPGMHSVIQRIVGWSILMSIIYIISIVGFKGALVRNVSPKRAWNFWMGVLSLGVWVDSYVMFVDLFSDKSVSIETLFTNIPMIVNVVWGIVSLVLIGLIFKAKGRA